MIKFPLTKKFRSTTYFRAFLLNSINVTLSTFIGYVTHFYIDKNTKIPVWLNLIITVFIRSITCFLIHILMFYLFRIWRINVN